VNRVIKIYCIDIPENFTTDAPKKHFVIKKINFKDLKIIEQIEFLEEWLTNKVEKKLMQNDMCIVALEKNRVVGFNMISFGKIFIPSLEKTIQLKQNEAWSYQITVHKNYRNQHIGAALRYKVFYELVKKNIKKLYGATYANNKGALKLADRTGFHVISEIHYKKFFNLEEVVQKWCG